MKNSTGSTLSDLGLNTGKKTRLHRILFKSGIGNGKAMFLPIDQGIEHGPVDFFKNPESENPEFQLAVAKEAGYSGIVFHIGIAEKYMNKFAGEVPLVLKLNGKTNIPPENDPVSPQLATVEDAVRLGADAVGYTLYVGSPSQERDIVQFAGIRRDAEKYGMPIIVWAYPRGEAIEARGGKDSMYAIDYAARTAAEVGADLVKVNYPDPARESKGVPKAYADLKLTPVEAVNKVVRSAGRCLTLISGGAMMSDQDLLDKAEVCMKGGATGLIFGRNIWQRKYDEAVKISREIAGILKKY